MRVNIHMKVKNNKKGFTLPELVVTLIVLAIILAIGIPTAINYIRRAEFRKNEETSAIIKRDRFVRRELI